MMWSVQNAAAAALVIASQGCSAANPLGPGSGPWSVEAPEDHGSTKAAMEAGSQDVFKNARTRDCFVVIKDGALIHEQYSGNNGANKAHAAWSMTKTLGALLMGHGVTKYGVDIDADTTKYGVESPVGYPVTTREIMAQAIAGSNGPGDEWAYDAIGSQWLEKLPAILQNASGIEPAIMFEQEMRGVLGLSDKFQWKPSPNKDWAAGSEGTCRDWARIGQLVLNKGKWADSAPLVSSSYVEDMTTPQRFGNNQNYANTCYGLLTWLPSRPNPKYPGTCYLATDVTISEDRYFPESFGNSYSILGGIFGQNVVVIPDDNMVLVSMGFTIPDLKGLTRNAQKMVNGGWCIGLNKDC